MTSFKIVRERKDTPYALATIAFSDPNIPSLGGCRLNRYPKDEDAEEEAKKLAWAMHLKCRGAGIPFGGAKMVVSCDPEISGAERERLLKWLGEIVEEVHPPYITGQDMNIGTHDLEVMALKTNRVLLRDTAYPTALGVVEAIRACFEFRGIELSRIQVAVQGVGKVGSRIVELLDGRVRAIYISDINPERVYSLYKKPHRSYIEIVEPSQIYTTSAHLFVPAASSGVLTKGRVYELYRAGTEIICGPANNQLATPEVIYSLDELDMVWVPDWIASAGGIIQAVGEAVERGLIEYPPVDVEKEIFKIGLRATTLLKRWRSQNYNDTRGRKNILALALESIGEVQECDIREAQNA